jgi:hypothetical protein
MAQFTELDLLNIACNTARAMPNVAIDGVLLPCKTINTVAHMRDMKALAQTDNLGKDSRIIGKNLFYSRSWEAQQQSANAISWGYPALFMASNGEELVRTGQYQCEYVFALADKRRPQQKNVAVNYSECEQRADEEVESDLRSLFASFFATLRAHIRANGYDAGSVLVFDGWATPSGLATQMPAPIARYAVVAKVAAFIADGYKSDISYDDYTENSITLYARVQITFTECAQTFPVFPDSAYQNTQIAPCCP